MSASYLHLDTKVRDIVNNCRSVSILPPVVSELCQSPEFKQIFWSSLNQDLHVICQRSQILAHGEVTAIQKAFVVLMEKKNLIPAVELYVDEILGLKFVSETERATILNTMIQTRQSILGFKAYRSKPIQSYTAGDHALPSSSQSVLSDHKLVSEALFVSDGSEGSRTSDLPHVASEQDEKRFMVDKPDFEDEKLKRLFVVYHKARKDFDATLSKTLERTKSAKFLRDTTENCLAYIAAKQTRPGGEVTCDRLLQELRATLEETIAIAEKGSGGKKRRFDENWENVPQEPARMRGRGPSVARPLRKFDPIPGGRTSEKKQRPITSCVEERQVSRKPDYRQQSMSLNLAKRRRSHLPPQLHPASTGESVRRVFGDRHKPHAERNPLSGHVYGDRYRPTYKYG